MNRQAIVFFRIASTDPDQRLITFTLGKDPGTYAAAGGFATVKDALSRVAGDPLAKMGLLEAIGEVARVAADDFAETLTITAYVSDDAEWRKVEAGVYTGARLALYGDTMSRAEPGRLTLVDRPEPQDVILRGASRHQTSVEAALDRAAATTRRADAALRGGSHPDQVAPRVTH